MNAVYLSLHFIYICQFVFGFACSCLITLLFSLSYKIIHNNFKFHSIFLTLSVCVLSSTLSLGYSESKKKKKKKSSVDKSCRVQNRREKSRNVSKSHFITIIIPYTSAFYIFSYTFFLTSEKSNNLCPYPFAIYVAAIKVRSLLEKGTHNI